MKAISFRQQLSIENPESLIDVVVDKPKPGFRDLLVQVHAISVNPVDTKIRKGSGPGQPSGELKILGWDASGIVEEVGSAVTLFKPGDEVYYAGSVDRPGSYAEFQAVDERIVGKKPVSIDFASAAALPLTTITAWEMLFDRLSLRKDGTSDQGAILIIGGAGGVGSIAIQLAKKLTGLRKTSGSPSSTTSTSLPEPRPVRSSQRDSDLVSPLRKSSNFTARRAKAFSRTGRAPSGCAA